MELVPFMQLLLLVKGRFNRQSSEFNCHPGLSTHHFILIGTVWTEATHHNIYNPSSFATLAPI